MILCFNCLSYSINNLFHSLVYFLTTADVHQNNSELWYSDSLEDHKDDIESFHRVSILSISNDDVTEVPIVLIVITVNEID